MTEEDEDKIIDLNEFTKTSETINMDPSRFLCILSQTAAK